MTDLTILNIPQLLAALRTGQISSREIANAYLARTEWLEPAVHAFLHLAPEAVLAAAEQADRRWAAWRRSKSQLLPPLLGIPLAVKDVLCVEGMPCTCGSRILEGFYPPYSATTVARLIEAGMVVLGKTNTDEFAMGSSTEQSAYGATHNPWDLARVPGGSSGGSAAAVAARLAPAALGTDTGGSVRHPAAFCGVTAIKPSYGRVSRYGLAAFGSSLDVVGAFGRSAQDAALIFQAMAGKDPRDATTLDVPLPEIEWELPGSAALKGLRIGIPDEYFIPGLKPEVERLVRVAIARLESLGAELLSIRLPHTEYALPVYYILAPAEASANLARYDGIRYGARIPVDSMWEVFRRTRGEKFGPEVKRRIMLGTYALSAGYYDAFYGQAQKARTLIRRDFDLAFENVDLIAAPVTPGSAFRLGEHANDPLAMYLEDIFTLPANLAGIPALAFPVGFDRAGLPVGMQLMAPFFEEGRLFKAGIAYQMDTQWHLASPSL